MAKDKIALTLIVKGTYDEAQGLKDCLESIHKHVDGIFINVNTKPGVEPDPEVLRVCEEYEAYTITSEWGEHFANKRNEIADQVPPEYQWIIWLDSDDTVSKPQKLRNVIKNAKGLDAVYVNYLYDFDEYGNPLTVHLSARLYRNNGSHRWKGRIHETLVETRAARTGFTEDIEIIHHASEDRRDASLERNIRLLEMELEDNKAEPDARILFYLAGSYIDAGRDDEAKVLLEQYVKLSGWDQERAQAYCHLGRIANRQDRLMDAKLNFLLATGEAPDDPEAFVELGQLESELNNLEKALVWLNIALNTKDKPTTLVRNPQSVAYRANLLAAEACLTLGGSHIEEALGYAENAYKAKPKDKFTKDMVSRIKHLISKKKQLKGIIEKVKVANGDKKATRAILAKVPKDLHDNPVIVQLRAKFEPFTWPEKSIAIFTGEAAIGEWGPWSLQDGIGGSEEAIIRISKHLKSLGYKVVIFATVGDRAGDYDGVQWRNHWECQLEDNFDIFIAWRNPFLFDKKIKASKTYLWLHDVMDKGEFTPERLANIDKVMLLSKYHRTCYPMIPDDKVLYSGNGIDPDEFEGLDGKVKRDPHNLTYQSSHVRGLRFLYEIWPDVKKAVPDATLDVYYGWDSYDKINAGNPERMAWKDEMVQLEKSLDGVTDHGKVGQDKIVEATFKAGIWAYPTTFPEIYCITAIKAQAGGAIPVCSNYAALEEMVQSGEKMDLYPMTDKGLEHYKERLIWWLTHPEEQEKERQKAKDWGRGNSWLATAEGWVDDFVR